MVESTGEVVNTETIHNVHKLSDPILQNSHLGIVKKIPDRNNKQSRSFMALP